jgi:ACS family glucarate transporter-like MFS transporter
VSGIIGIIWSIIWFYYYRDNPKKHKGLKHREKIILENSLNENNSKKTPWKKYLQNKKIFGISLGFFCYNYLKSFHLTWFPIFLVETKGMDFINLGVAAIIPPFFAVGGELFTGYLMDKSIEKGVSPTYAKKMPVCVGLLLSSIIIFSVFTSNIVAVIILITLSYVFLISSSVGIWSIPDELSKNKRSVAVIGSIQNTFSNTAGIIAPIITGYLYSYSGSFLLPFMVSTLVSIIGALSYWYIVGELKPIDL